MGKPMRYLWAVVHDGAVVVLCQVERVDLLVLRAVRRVHVLPVYLDEVIPVTSHLLVPQSERVTDLVHWDTKLHDKPTNYRCTNVQKEFRNVKNVQKHDVNKQAVHGL